MFSAFVIFGTIGALALVLILAMVKVAQLVDRVFFLKSELEASDQLVKNRDGEIDKLRGKIGGSLERAAAADRRWENATKLKDETLAKITAVNVESTKALVAFHETLQNIFGKETGKPLDQRLRAAFDKHNIKIDEIKLFPGETSLCTPP